MTSSRPAPGAATCATPMRPSSAVGATVLIAVGVAAALADLHPPVVSALARIALHLAILGVLTHELRRLDPPLRVGALLLGALPILLGSMDALARGTGVLPPIEPSPDGRPVVLAGLRLAANVGALTSLWATLSFLWAGRLGTGVAAAAALVLAGYPGALFG